MSKTGVAALVAAGLVAGCGTGTSVRDNNTDAYGAYVQENVDLRRELEQLPRVLTGDVPTSGSASYEGTVGFAAGVDSSEERSLFGSISIAVEFGDDAVSGRIFDIVSDGNVFTEEGAGPVQGQLVLSNGEIVRDSGIDPLFDNYLNADLTGTLVEPGNIGTRTYDLTLTGALFGPNQEMISGNVNGTTLEDAFFARVTGTFVAQQ